MAEEKQREQRVNHAAVFVKQYWFLIAFFLSVVGGGITLFGKVEYVTNAVNPESLQVYAKEQAILHTKREIRWCLSKLAWNNTSNRASMMACAD